MNNALSIITLDYCICMVHCRAVNITFLSIQVNLIHDLTCYQPPQPRYYESKDLTLLLPSIHHQE
jgi:hypothetical protein